MNVGDLKSNVKKKKKKKKKKNLHDIIYHNEQIFYSNMIYLLSI
jgi:hypothetical protein